MGFHTRFYCKSLDNGVLEYSFLVQSSKELSLEDRKLLEQIIGFPLSLNSNEIGDNIVERGPKIWIESEWGSNAKSILHKCGLKSVSRIEKYMRGLQESLQIGIDQMVEFLYTSPVQEFSDKRNASIRTNVERILCDKSELIQYSLKHSLGFTEEDIEWYYQMWVKQGRTHVTELELHDLAQSNSEHSRHHIFRGNMYLQNESKTTETLYGHSLFTLVKKPLKKLQEQRKSDNSVVAFCDNSSAITGFDTFHLQRTSPGCPASEYMIKPVSTNTLFTAETHNFPTGIAPFPGAATGTGGRIRDVQAIGRGGMFVAGTAGYCVGSMNECSMLPRKEYLHTPKDILIQASNGASDYGNKIGEPIIQGFTRSFGMNIQTHNKRLEWIKPIMFTSGIGMVYTDHLHKNKPKTGMVIARVGGPAYRIGVGGGTASSTSQHTTFSDEYESSVQRGDPEMGQKMDRFIRACIEMGTLNPIESIHDQGAGGMCNVTKEIVESEDMKKGAIIDIRKVVSADDTMSLRELWIAEYQEQNTFLCKPDCVGMLQKIADREGVSVAFVGNVTDDGVFTVHDTLSCTDTNTFQEPIVEFVLKDLQEFPKKEFILPYVEPELEDLSTPHLEISNDLDIQDCLTNVLQHINVCSKRFLTNKVDRSVSGLIAQQQCIGPLHTPLADVAIIAHSYFDITGAATAIGEKPMIGISCPARMARMAVGEMVTNMMWVKTEGLHSIKCSGNWMWPAKENVEKRRMLLCAKALSDIMCELELSIDGGKDSLSMSSTTRKTQEKIDAPPQLVISGYTSIQDITNKVTPDLKSSGNALLYINPSQKYRLGGSTFVQTLNLDSGVSGIFSNDYPDLEDASNFSEMFDSIQLLVNKNLIESGHDISDGGLITCVLEMAFAGNKGLKLSIDTSDVLCTDDRFIRYRWMSALFSEELGCVIEVPSVHLNRVKNILSANNVPYQYIGYVTNENNVSLKLDGEVIIDRELNLLRNDWERTSFELERMQSNEHTVREENINLSTIIPSNKNKSFGFECTEKVWQSLYADNYNDVCLRNSIPNRPRVAIIREEGSNGDREMCAAFWTAGFEPCDVMVSDMIAENSPIDLKQFSGIVFVGGFTFSDVFGAAKGWESVIRNHPTVRKQFEWYFSDENTTRFSLGICNGCQLMCRMGWVGEPFEGESNPPVPQTNKSSRFESRFCKVKISKSNSVLLKDMENCTIGVWVAHGEGRFGNEKSKLSWTSIKSFPLRYVDHEHTVCNALGTRSYPENPNGSAYGIAGAISKNGLHLAMMPHPERSTKMWQQPWYPKEWQSNIDATYDGLSMPWSKMFKNAYDFSNKMK